MKNKFCREILSLSFLALLFLQVPAQEKALKIGDAIPEKVWTTPLPMVNSPNKTITLAKDRDKLILLDFWATWCGSCLKNFPKMEALEKQFEGKMKVVAVTKENRPTLDKFFGTKNGQRYRHMASVTDDKMFAQMFPHLAIPFIVWMKNGKVINTTDAEQVTASNISALLKGEVSELQTVIQIDRNRPLMLAEQFDLEKSTTLINYVLFSKGKIRAIPPGSGFHRKDSVTYGRQFTNVSLLNMYKGIAYELFAAQGQHFNSKRFLNQVKVPDLLSFSPSDTDVVVAEKSYNFEYIVPPVQHRELYPKMLKTLNEYVAYNGNSVMERRKCLVIKKNSEIYNKVLTGTIKDQIIKGQTLDALISDLNELPMTPLLIIDESTYKGKLAIDISKIPDLKSLRKVLKNEGFQLEEEQRDILMFIIKDHDPNNLTSLQK